MCGRARGNRDFYAARPPAFQKGFVNVRPQAVFTPVSGLVKKVRVGIRLKLGG